MNEMDKTLEYLKNLAYQSRKIISEIIRIENFMNQDSFENQYLLVRKDLRTGETEELDFFDKNDKLVKKTFEQSIESLKRELDYTKKQILETAKKLQDESGY